MRSALILMILLLSACQVFQPEDTQATAQAGVSGLATEAAMMQETLFAAETQVIATAYAAETHVFERNNVNRLLLATVRAVIPPTPAVSVGSLSSSGGVLPTAAAGEVLYTTTGISTAVRRSDDCVENPVARVPVNSSLIYATAVGLNVAAGTQMSSEWYYDSALVWSDVWIVPRDFNELCFWFSVSPSEVTFAPGNWSVRLFANGTPIGQPMAFVMVDVMDSMEEG